MTSNLPADHSRFWSLGEYLHVLTRALYNRTPSTAIAFMNCEYAQHLYGGWWSDLDREWAQ
ncbi:hypothetical protein PROFUN_07476 [Planoprotostelium fungivorum]|uniref:Uncharacterized protein n=1 Tax=Planoprotostelium fungivorum TaxID=1890364 RepID=A0A2P6NLL8_9EUKA|nr:hypothetical protein PROFUN_07476 [Planoprotostelium fungivorum]